jgi:signal transduction histidine kinase/PAS domain-containing protein
MPPTRSGRSAPGSATPCASRAGVAAAADRDLRSTLPLVVALALGGGLAGWAWLRSVRGQAHVAEALRAERTRLGAVLAQLPAGVVVADAATGRLVFGNARFEEIWRRPFTGGSWPGDPAPWMQFSASPALWPTVGAQPAGASGTDGPPPAPGPLARALARGEPVLGEEVPLARADGTSGVQRVHAAPVRDASGRIVAGVAVVEDVTALHESRTAAARVAEQLAGLQHATAALGSALSVEAIGDIVVGRLTALFGAAAGSLAVVDPGTGVVRIVRAVGYPDAVSREWERRAFPPDLGLPLTDAARSGQAIYLTTLAAWRARYPGTADGHAASGFDGAAALPCVAAGEVLGVVSLSFRGPCPLVDEDRALGETLAAQCAQALYRARLLAAQEEARAAAEASARHIAQIQRLTERVSTALTTADVMRVVGEDVAGAVAGASAAVYAARPTDGLLQLASEFGEQLVCETDELLPGSLRTEAAALAEEAVATERLVIRLTPASAPLATCVALPLGAGPGVVGALVLELRPPRPLTPMEQGLLLATGRIAAQGITRARLQSLREEERRRLARELHDEFGQTLTALKLDLAYLGGRLANDGGEGGPALAHEVRTMTAQVDGALDALRRIAAALRPAALDDLGLATALEWQAGEFERRTGVVCTLDVDLDDEVAEPAATAVFRVFQEALTNVARHARARRVHAWLTSGGGALRLRVADDGVGLPADGAGRPGALGLVGMRERAAALGGTLLVAARPGGGGTDLVLDIPYAPSASSAGDLNAAEPRPTSRADQAVQL